MTKQTKKAYKAVIKDLKSQMGKPCKDISPICAKCITNRMAYDLEYLYKLFIDCDNAKEIK